MWCVFSCLWLALLSSYDFFSLNSHDLPRPGEGHVFHALMHEVGLCSGRLGGIRRQAQGLHTRQGVRVAIKARGEHGDQDGARTVIRRTVLLTGCLSGSTCSEVNQEVDCGLTQAINQAEVGYGQDKQDTVSRYRMDRRDGHGRDKTSKLRT